MLSYGFDHDCVEIEEKRNGDDYEFHIRCLSDDYRQQLLKIRAFFADNDIHTDVIFYTHKDHEYQIIARKDVYVDFVLSLFKYGLLNEVRWS